MAKEPMTTQDAAAREAEARRLGQFEGQVLANLSDMKKAMESIVASSAAFDARLRATETTIVKHEDQFKDSMAAHEDIYKKLETMAQVMSNLVSFQDKAQGFKTATAWIAGISSSVVTAFIVFAITRYLK